MPRPWLTARTHLQASRGFREKVQSRGFSKHREGGGGDRARLLPTGEAPLKRSCLSLLRSRGAFRGGLRHFQPGSQLWLAEPEG